MEYTGYWMFVCNPRQWAIDDFLDQGIEISTWKVTDYQKDYFNIGDLAVIRVGIDNRTKTELGGKAKLAAGIYAVVKILELPKYVADLEDNFWLNKNKSEEKTWRVKIKYLRNYIDSPILISNLKNGQKFDEKSPIIKGRQTSSWPISKNDFNLIESEFNQIDKEISYLYSENFYTDEEITTAIKKFEHLTPRKKEIISRRIERGELSKIFKQINNYRCQICDVMGKDSFSFLKSNGIPYIETHHVFPVSKLQKGSLGIGNLLTVCANHHRQIHYGDFNVLDSTNFEFCFKIEGEIIKVKKKYN